MMAEAERIPLDDRDADWLARFWSTLSTAHWPVRSPDPEVLDRLKLDFHVGHFAEDDPYAPIPNGGAGDG